MVEKMDRYQRVEKPKTDTPIDENEIRITSQGRMRNYITYAMSLLHVFLFVSQFFFFFFFLHGSPIAVLSLLHISLSLSLFFFFA